MAENERSATVKSVFKNGESTTTERKFTEMWIWLVNTAEKNKNGILSKKRD